MLDGSRVRLHLSAPDVDAITAAHPAAEPAPDGATLALEEIDGQQLNHWVRRAWAFRAPQELAGTAAAAATARPGEVGDLPRAIGRPATRALADAGVTTLAQVAADAAGGAARPARCRAQGRPGAGRGARPR